MLNFTIFSGKQGTKSTSGKVPESTKFREKQAVVLGFAVHLLNVSFHPWRTNRTSGVTSTRVWGSSRFRGYNNYIAKTGSPGRKGSSDIPSKSSSNCREWSFRFFRFFIRKWSFTAFTAKAHNQEQTPPPCCFYVFLAETTHDWWNETRTNAQRWKLTEYREKPDLSGYRPTLNHS